MRANQSTLTVLVTVATLLAGCAAGSTRRAAQLAESQQDFDRAVVEYTKLLQLRPNDRDARASLEQAKLRAAQGHFSTARRLASIGRFDDALQAYQLAAELNPTNATIQDEMRTTRAQQRAKVDLGDSGLTQLQSLVAKSLEAPMPGTQLPDDLVLPESVIFREANASAVYRTLAQLGNLNIAFDPTFRDQPISVDLRKSKLSDAFDSVSMTTRNFWKSTGQRNITIAPDTPAKRREYEDEIVRTFYLSNADLKETLDILRIVVDVRRIAPLTATNAITIKDTPERIAAVQKIVSAIDKPRPEVVIDVELLEVDRTRMKDYGLQIATPASAGLNGSVGLDKDPITVDTLRSLTATNVLISGLPRLYYRLLKSDTATRVLANPQLRTSEGIAAQARFGDRVPVPVTTFAPIAAGGVQTQPITSFNYENIGVNIDITPRTHHDDDVSLAVRIEVSNISGRGFGDLPTFGNRSINTVIRLKDGETNMLAGLIRDDERKSASGIAGLSDLPLIGALFASNHRESQQTDIILTLTPRIVRTLRLDAEDLAPFRVGRDSGAPLIDIPLPSPMPPPPPRQPGDAGDAGITIVPPGPTPQTTPLLPIPQPAQPVKPPVKPPPPRSY